METDDLSLVWQLKKDLAEQLGGSTADLLLWQGQRELQDFEVLRDAGVVTGQMLYLLRKTKGMDGRCSPLDVIQQFLIFAAIVESRSMLAN